MLLSRSVVTASRRFLLHPSVSSRRLFSAPAATTTATLSASQEAQKSHWESYLASGRGSRALFAAIDTTKSQTLTPAEIKAFLQAVDRHDGVSPTAFAALNERARNHALDLQEFQDWLLMATRDKGYTELRPLYEAQPHLGERSVEKQEPAEQQEQQPPKYTWNQSTMSQSLRRMQYAVRGPVVLKADALAAEGREIIFTNIGNPHAVGQQPITFYRQVLALCDLPAENGVDHPQATQLFPKDVLERARELRAIVGSAGTGAYTNSQGILGIRESVVRFLQDRDGHPAYAGDIFLTDGASSGIEQILTTLICGNADAIMIPIPQYPIYSALITRLGAHQIRYELDEEQGWTVTREELERRWEEAQARDLIVKGLVLINPGNPTGQVMTREHIETICRFCADHGIVLLADEVYQRNVYAPDRAFVSAKKVALETPGCENLQLVSFHSTSKGLLGECGKRGAYMELHGIDPYVQSQIYKLASSGLCSGVTGQIVCDLMVDPPTPGSESYDLFAAQEKGIYDSLARKAKSLVEGLNSIDGITCNPAEGAMYAFPRLDLPQGALEEAEATDQTPDTLYALSLLEDTGICVVPASGFGQKEGRVGFRTTFLPPEETLERAVTLFGEHHQKFCDRFARRAS